MTTPDDAKVQKLIVGLDMLAHGLHIHNPEEVRAHAATILESVGFTNHNTRAALEAAPQPEHDKTGGE